MNRKYLLVGFFCMFTMAFLLFILWLEMDNSSSPEPRRNGSSASDSRGSASRSSSPREEDNGPPETAGGSPGPVQRNPSGSPSSSPPPSSQEPSPQKSASTESAGRPSPGPRPEDSEGPSDYSFVQSPPDCSQWRRETDQAKHFARQTDKALLLLASLSMEEENRMGDELWQQFLEESGGKLLSEGPLVDYVRATAERIIPLVKRKDATYKLFVYNEEDVNAFAMPGGHIVINKGLITSVDNQAQLAAVIGHEIAHNDLKHCISNLLIAKEILGEANDITLTLVWFLRLPLSSENEFEADQWGMELAMLAGFSPFQAPAFMDSLPAGENWSESFELPVSFGNPIWDRIAQEIANKVMDEVENLVSTHPKPPLRACTMRNWLSQHFKDKDSGWYLVGAQSHKQVAR